MGISMIKSIKYSAVAQSIAVTAFRRHVAWRMAKYGFKSETIQIGAVPVFQLSLEEAANRNWKLHRRRGWRFICTAPDERIGAVIGIRKRPWQHPSFSGFSIGERAVFHCLAAVDADHWASLRDATYVARVVRHLNLGLEFLCLYEIGDSQPAWVAELSSGRKSRNWIDETAKLAEAQLGHRSVVKRQSNRERISLQL
jgi:hypothetical protein